MGCVSSTQQLQYTVHVVVHIRSPSDQYDQQLSQTSQNHRCLRDLRHWNCLGFPASGPLVLFIHQKKVLFLILLSTAYQLGSRFSPVYNIPDMQELAQLTGPSNPHGGGGLNINAVFGFFVKIIKNLFHACLIKANTSLII